MDNNVNPGLINPGWWIVVVPPNSDFYGYWNGTPQLDSRLGFINPGLTLVEKLWDKYDWDNVWTVEELIGKSIRSYLGRPELTKSLQTCGKKRGTENPHVCWDMKPLQVCWNISASSSWSGHMGPTIMSVWSSHHHRSRMGFQTYGYNWVYKSLFVCHMCCP